MKIFAIIISILCLASCSSTSDTLETKYYLLNSPSINKSISLISTDSEQPKKKEVVLIIEVAEYLQQPFIAMQIDEHSLYYAQSHLWAEPLKSDIMVALALELNNSSSTNNYTLVKGNAARYPSNKLFITIEHFHASKTGNIILTGNFQWVDKAINDENQQLIQPPQQPFYLETALEVDGFTHSVSKMRELLTQLAIDLNKVVSL